MNAPAVAGNAMNMQNSPSFTLTDCPARANPLLNHVILFPLCGNGVNRMLAQLKREQFVDKSKSDLVARFGRPSIQRAIPSAREELIFTCRPWYYGSYPEGVCVIVSQDQVVSFAYYH